MTADKKAGRFSGKWAIVTVHPWLPSRSDQIARARAWGVDERLLGAEDVSALFVDDVRCVKRTTNWPAKLVERQEFLRTVNKLQHVGDQVFFANPLCVGFSEKHARSTVEGMFDAGLLVYVQAVQGGGSALYKRGDDMTEFLASVGAMANAAHQRSYQAARRKREKARSVVSGGF